MGKNVQPIQLWYLGKFNGIVKGAFREYVQLLSLARTNIFHNPFLYFQEKFSFFDCSFFRDNEVGVQHWTLHIKCNLKRLTTSKIFIILSMKWCLSLHHSVSSMFLAVMYQEFIYSLHSPLTDRHWLMLLPRCFYPLRIKVFLFF